MPREDDFTNTVEEAAKYARDFLDPPKPHTGQKAHPCPVCHGTPLEGPHPFVYLLAREPRPGDGCLTCHLAGRIPVVGDGQ